MDKTNLQSHRNSYERLAGRHSLKPLTLQIEHHRQALHRHSLQSARSIHRLVLQKRQSLTLAAKLYDSLSYKSVLARGFAVVRDDKDAPLTSVGSVKPGSPISIELQDGKIKGRLDGKKPLSTAKETQGSLL